MSLEDKAQDHEASEWAMRNTAHPDKPMFGPSDAGYGPKECEECESTMPLLRRANGWVLCTSCQSLVERGQLIR